MPPIETLDDLNNMLSACGCCSMPSCPTPEIKYQRRLSAASVSAVHIEAAPNWTAWKKSTQRLWTSWNPALPAPSVGSSITYRKENREQIQVQEVSGFFVITSTGDPNTNAPVTSSCSGSGTSEISQLRGLNCSGVPTWITDETNNAAFTFVGGNPDPANPPNNYPSCWFQVDRTVTSYTGANCAGPGTSSVVNSTTFTSLIYFIAPGSGNSGIDPKIYTTSIDAGAWISQASTLLDAALDQSENWLEGIGGGCKWTQTFPVDGTLSPSPSLQKSKIRFRFKIPNSHTGSYFKITYDIAFFPSEGEDVLVSEDNVVEWTGPGTGGSEDSSWLTPWVEMDPPDSPGEKRIVNVRYTCYHGSFFGAAPQVMGESFP